MANAKKKKARDHVKERRIWAYVVIALFFMFIIWYEYYSAQQEENHENADNYHVEIIDEPIAIIPEGEVLNVHMINCKQADAFLFEQNGQYGLIDCGTRSTGKDVVNYLNNQGVEELQFVVGTHPHDDHMGGMEAVIDNFRCNQIYIPKVEKGLITTNWYISLMKKIKTKKLKVTNPKFGDEFNLEDAIFKVVGQLTPEEAGQNVNNYSTVIKVSFGQMDILMTGDAEVPVERKMLESNVSLQCEILKAGHHGSNTSTSEEFFQKVSPEYALISCGIGNKYNHPCEETLLKFEKSNTIVYRTDESGDVVITVSSDNIKFDKLPGDYLDGPTLAKLKGVS